MHPLEQHRDIAIFRPAGAEYMQMYQTDVDANPQRAEFAEAVEDIIDDIRGAFHAVSDGKIDLQFREYAIQEESDVPSGTARRQITHAHIITSIQPSDSQLAYIMACMRRNPVMSLLLCSMNDFYDQRLDHLATLKIHLFGQDEPRQTRVFLTQNPRDTDALQRVARDVLRYPFAA